jgi:NADP-dependent aldehyde dehydrogenase
VLLDEAFGPLSIVVEYQDETDLPDIAAEVFEGNLTGTVHAAIGEDTTAVRSLLDCITRNASRVLFG